MTLQTLIKQVQKSGLVVIPRREYREFLDFKTRNIPVYKATKAELQSLARAEKEIAQGKFTPWEEVKNELANIRRKHSKKAAK